MTVLLAVIVAVGLTGGGIWGGLRLLHYRSAYYEQCGISDELMERALQAERDGQKALDDLAYLKNSIQIIASRDTVAILTDQQIQFIVNAISQVLISSQKPLDQLN